MQDTIAEGTSVPHVCRVTAATRFGRDKRGALLVTVGLLTGGVLAGCSTGGGNTFTVFADPGKYQYYSCEQIAGQIKRWSTREQELRALMDKAGRGTGGTVVNLLAYRADYVAATEELKVLDATARDKKCDTPANWGSNTVIR